MYPRDVYVQINPLDAKRLKIEPNQWIFITTKRGRIKVKAMIMQAVAVGQLFLPMHYEETNKLTFPAFDPYSRQPSYKMSATHVSKDPHY